MNINKPIKKVQDNQKKLRTPLTNLVKNFASKTLTKKDPLGGLSGLELSNSKDSSQMVMSADKVDPIYQRSPFT